MQSGALRLSLAAVAALSLALPFAGCSSEEEKSSPAGPTPGAGLGGCYPSDPSCGIANSKCMAKIDNSASAKKTLRMMQLQVTLPKVLASKAIQFTVVGPAVSLNEPQCNLISDKGGLFNWLVEIDTDAKKLKTGGAPPVTDANAGFCFINQQFGSLTAGPIETTIDYDEATGNFATNAPLSKVVVPIYTDATGTPPILLPLTDAHLKDGTLSEGGNCIGRFKGEEGELDENCQTMSSDPTSDDSYQYVNAATITGHITLAEADDVDVVSLGDSLCVLLTNKESTDTPGKCARKADGSIDAEGDHDADGDGVKESFMLSAKLAAASVKITGDCN